MKDRRKVLMGLAGASAATVWNKPVVDSVILPAHAVTTLSGDVFTAADGPNERICAGVNGNVVSIIWIVGGYCIAPQGTAKFRWEGTAVLNGGGSVQVAEWGTNCRSVCPFPTPDETTKSCTATMVGNQLFITLDGNSEGDFGYLMNPVDQCPDLPTLPTCTSCENCL